MDEECENLIIVNDGGEHTENISQKSFTIAYKCLLREKCCWQEYFFSKLWNIYCETVR